MKAPKESRRLSKEIFKHSLVDGRVDESKIRSAIASLVAAKHRHYVATIVELRKLLVLELGRHHAIISSATPLTAAQQTALLGQLTGIHGGALTSEFAVQPSLLGGLRVQIGSDVWDNSVSSRLDSLRKQFN